MSVILGLECIGDDGDQLVSAYRFIFDIISPGTGTKAFKGWGRNHWVAEITGFHEKYKYERKFLSYKKDHTYSNSTGSRGVYAYYVLEEGKLYEVSSPESWSTIDRYFCTVKNGEIKKLSREEATQWLKNI